MESRFTSFLSANYVPTKDEVDEIRQLLVDPVNQLDQLDAEITRLQNTIDTLSLKRNKLHNDIVCHRNLIAPLRRIPEELLQEIFFHCLPVDHNAVMSCFEAPLLFGRVCSQWRRVSISTPRLWSSIHIVLPGDIPPWDSSVTISQTSSIHGAVKEWLGRSGDLPLSISLFCVPFVYVSQASMEELMLSLIPFSSRWKKVALILPSFLGLSLFSLSHKALPLLETFFFHSTTTSPTPLPEYAPLDIFRAPHIHTLSSYHLGVIPQDMKWSQLTSLSLESRGHGEGMLTPFKALGILAKSPNLIFCELDFVSRRGGVSIPNGHEVVTMPSLQTLSIHEGASSLQPLFSHLQLPVLDTLLFSTSPTRQHPDTNVPEELSICTLLRRLNSLKKFTFSALDLTSDNLKSCLGLVPSITQLSLLTPQRSDSWPLARTMGNAFNDEVAALLTPSKGQPLVCPLLKVLECNPCDASDTTLLTFIEQRTIHAPAHEVPLLERVDVFFGREKELDIPIMLPPNVLAETSITLRYFAPPAVERPIVPRAGLGKPDRLQIPSSTCWRLHH